MVLKFGTQYYMKDGEGARALPYLIIKTTALVWNCFDIPRVDKCILILYSARNKMNFEESIIAQIFFQNDD